jgi:predicted XRE-type DNA-binding protein
MRRSSALRARTAQAPNGLVSDIGLQSAGVSTKTTLASKINHLIDEQGFSQTIAAERLGIPQSKVSAIRNYRLHGISLERLMQVLVALDQRVEIVVRPGGAPPRRSITVVS